MSRSSSIIEITTGISKVSFSIGGITVNELPFFFCCKLVFRFDVWPKMLPKRPWIFTSNLGIDPVLPYPDFERLESNSLLSSSLISMFYYKSWGVFLKRSLSSFLNISLTLLFNCSCYYYGGNKSINWFGCFSSELSSRIVGESTKSKSWNGSALFIFYTFSSTSFSKGIFRLCGWVVVLSRFSRNSVISLYSSSRSSLSSSSSRPPNVNI